VSAHVVIGHESSLGARTVIYPNATVYPRCRIGARCIVHSGAVLGADGFGFDRTATGWRKIPQVGWVVIADDVEIGANTAIDRATAGETYIGAGSKVDNLVQVAHNTRVGCRTLLIAQVGVAGSSVVGDDVVLAGQVGVSDHVTIGNRSMVAAQAGVIASIPDDSIVGGTPARPHMEQQRAQAVVQKLPDMRVTVRDLVKRVAELEARLRDDGV
jgi:UDP-3-O-[3-hydroxymyristoyl] glucosamine N-acyltransferase